MNLADMLSYADIQQLVSIAKRYDCECDAHSKRELIQSILTKIGHKDWFEQFINEMSVEELRFINSLLFEQRSLFSLEELIARVQQTRFERDEQTQSSSPRDMIVKMRQSGWLFNGASQQTKYLFQVPEDLKERFKLVMKRRMEQELVSVQEPEAYRDEDGRIGEDIITMLRYFHESDNVPLNPEGVMYKKTQQLLIEKMSVMEEPVSKGEWRFGYGRRFHNYPNRLSLLYDYVFYQGWIEEHAGKLVVSASGLERLEKGAAYEPIQPIYRFWLKLYKNAIPNVSAIVHWIHLCTARWTTVESMEQALTPYVKPFFYDEPQSIIRQRIIQMLVHLGLLKIGEDANTGTSVQMSKRGNLLVKGVIITHEDKIKLG
ncbi:hypothetical protein NQ117_04575 [Paenibacillus sp. SC116]|uniref:hypothetical protein n=1 Tax=Paenibacillus sp. SC116 TaxID=2968986 RepID=UPI00215A4A87|nr:hypothetical protein [Paenibacillus sp. SC116]MCR8842946.1 hypothetical protein [Paenibacillus sp. SC116]